MSARRFHRPAQTPLTWCDLANEPLPIYLNRYRLSPCRSSIIAAGTMQLHVAVVAGRTVDVDKFTDDHPLAEVDVRPGRIGAVFDDGPVLIELEGVDGLFLVAATVIDRARRQHLDKRKALAGDGLVDRGGQVAGVEDGPPGDIRSAGGIGQQRQIEGRIRVAERRGGRFGHVGVVAATCPPVMP